MSAKQLNLFTLSEPPSGAVLSPCGLFRYRLWRRWGEGPRVLWVMYNPSTADSELDDPTIRRCIGFSKSWGYGGLEVVNLFARRTPDPRQVKTLFPKDPTCDEDWEGVRGPENTVHLKQAARDVKVARIVCAWGANPSGPWGKSTASLLRWAEGHLLHYLRLTKGGHPEHPLYLPGDLQPVLWEPPGK